MPRVFTRNRPGALAARRATGTVGVALGGADEVGVALTMGSLVVEPVDVEVHPMMTTVNTQTPMMLVRGYIRFPAEDYISMDATQACARRGSLGAEDGTRTRDPNLGKVVLYQLSHFRVCS